MDKLPPIDRLSTPVLLLPPPLTPKTPVTAQEIVEFTRNHLQGANQETGEYEVLLGRVTKLSRASVAIAAAKQKAEQDLKALTAAATYRKRQQKPDRRQIQAGGTIYVHDARLKAAARDKKELAKEERAAKKLLVQAQKLATERAHDQNFA
jgi:hypothetical protein